jgi:regulator of replication initiation timing
MSDFSNSLLNLVGNQKLQVLNQFFEKLVPSRLGEHQEIIQRISAQLTTEKDLKQFADLINDVYQNGYTKCFEHYREKLKHSGVEVRVDPN